MIALAVIVILGMTSALLIFISSHKHKMRPRLIEPMMPMDGGTIVWEVE